MTSGCLCCTIRGDIERRFLRFMVKENGMKSQDSNDCRRAKGLADPAPVIHTLISDPLLDSRYMLGGVITTVDAINGVATLDAHIECGEAGCCR